MLSILRRVAITCVALSACGDSTSTPPDAGEPGPDAPTGEPQATPGITYFDYPFVTSVSADGKTALFEELEAVGETTEASAVLYDTIAGLPVLGATIGDASVSMASAVSDNRHIAAQYGMPVQAGVWSKESNWSLLASPFSTGCEVHSGGAFDITPDGTAATGLLWNGCSPVAFRWREGGQVTPLQTLGTPAKGLSISNRGTVISRDGTIVGGFALTGNLDRTAAIWHEDGSGELLDPNAFDAPSEVLAMNADGTVLAGVLGYDAFIWTRGTGFASIRRPDSALPDDAVFPNGMTDDGRMVVGTLGGGGPFSSPPVAFIWSHRDGMRPLIDVARSAGISIPDTVVLGSAHAVSADGTVIVGAGEKDGTFKTYILRLPASAVAR